MAFAQMPTHPDYAQILQVLSESDDEAMSMATPPSTEEAEALVASIGDGLVDGESLYAVSLTRALAILHDIPPIVFLVDPVSVFCATFADAFVIGARFQRAGGSAG